MPGKFALLFTIVLSLDQFISAQRYLDTHTEVNSTLFTLEITDRILQASENDSSFRSIGDDAGIRMYNYPILDGRRMVLKGNKNQEILHRKINLPFNQ